VVLNAAVVTVPVPVDTSAVTVTSVVAIPGVGAALLGVVAVVRSPTASNLNVVAGPVLEVRTCSWPAVSKAPYYATKSANST
jgi:hypothetical protein